MESGKFGSFRSNGVRFAILLFLCGVVGALCSIVVLAVFAFIIVKSGSFDSIFKTAVFVSMLAGGLVSGFLAARGAGRSGLVTGLSASVVCVLLLWLVSLMPGGEGGRAFVLPTVMCLIGGLAGGIAGVNLGK